MLLNSIKTGLKKGAETILLLGKTIVPVYILVTILNNTPVIGWITALFKPLMGVFNLPGEAAIVLVIGNVLDTYSAVGAIKAIQLTAMEVTTLSIMISISHSLPVETAVTKKLGFKISHALIIRIGLAVVSGIIVGRVGALV
ncbi:MAG TPA: nucleoside recognition domain-containing protein [Oscillospiraceae bacterium]|nr:nucleoside recognition domain-containing protein [Oscillospiraceae bacterium]